MLILSTRRAIIDAAAEYGKGIEINAHPSRLGWTGGCASMRKRKASKYQSILTHMLSTQQRRRGSGGRAGDFRQLQRHHAVRQLPDPERDLDDGRGPDSQPDRRPARHRQGRRRLRRPLAGHHQRHRQPDGRRPCWSSMPTPPPPPPPSSSTRTFSSPSPPAPS